MNIKRSYNVSVDRAENSAFIVRAHGVAIVTLLESVSAGILGSASNASRQVVSSQTLQTETLNFAFAPNDEMRDPFDQIYKRLDKEIDLLVTNVFGKTQTLTPEVKTVKRGRGRPRKEAK